MLKEYIQALLLIFMAEMGDKSQILAMAFATQYKTRQVLTGVFLGILLNHGIAVLAGVYLSKFIPMNTIQIIAGFAFIGFALWTLKGEEEEEEGEGGKGYGPILTVALAFFIGELGDKTQLATITLATNSTYPYIVLLGTVSAMVLTSSVGIFIGSRVGDRIPELTIKIISAFIFLIFGYIKLFSTLPSQLLKPAYVIIFTLIILALGYILLRPALRAKREGIPTPLQEAALTLYKYRNHLREEMDKICLGEKNCGRCQGNSCIIGYTKELLDKGDISEEQGHDVSNSLKKKFDEGEVLNGLAITIVYLDILKDMDSQEKDVINKVRNSLERILFKEEFHFENKESYIKKIRSIDADMADRLENLIIGLS